jgi:hypothetical protein
MTDDDLLERCRRALCLHRTWDHNAKISAEDAVEQIRAAVAEYDQDWADLLSAQAAASLRKVKL